MKKNKDHDPRTVYADIIDLPRPSLTWPRMSPEKRAAQFAPFAALTGYEDMVREETRMTDTDHQKQLEEYETESLNRKIQRLINLTESGYHPTVAFTVFEPDDRKTGGRYTVLTDSVKRVDLYSRRIELMSMKTMDPLDRNHGINRSLQLDRIVDIHSDELDATDDADITHRNTDVSDRNP